MNPSDLGKSSTVIATVLIQDARMGNRVTGYRRGDGD